MVIPLSVSFGVSALLLERKVIKYFHSIIETLRNDNSKKCLLCLMAGSVLFRLWSNSSISILKFGNTNLSNALCFLNKIDENFDKEKYLICCCIVRIPALRRIPSQLNRLGF